MRSLGFMLTLLLLASTVAAADDDATKQAKKILQAFREEIRSESPEDRLRAVSMLDEIDHALIVKEIGRTVLPHADLALRELGARMPLWQVMHWAVLARIRVADGSV